MVEIIVHFRSYELWKPLRTGRMQFKKQNSHCIILRKVIQYLDLQLTQLLVDSLSVPLE